MVHILVMFLLSVMSATCMLTVATPCTRDNRMLGDVCTESEDASFFLQSSRTAIRGTPSEPKLPSKEEDIERHLTHEEAIDAAKMKAELAAAVKVLTAQHAEDHHDVTKPAFELVRTVEEVQSTDEDAEEDEEDSDENEEEESDEDSEEDEQDENEHDEVEETDRAVKRPWAELIEEAEEEEANVRVDKVRLPKRIDPITGIHLTQQDFQRYYGADWKKQWETATPVGKDSSFDKVKPRTRDVKQEKETNTATAAESHKDVQKRTMDIMKNVQAMWKKAGESPEDVKKEKVEEVHSVSKTAGSHNAGQAKLHEANTAEEIMRNVRAMWKTAGELPDDVKMFHHVAKTAGSHNADHEAKTADPHVGKFTPSKETILRDRTALKPESHENLTHADNLRQTAWSRSAGKVKLDEAKTADPLVEEATALNVKTSIPSEESVLRERSALKPESHENLTHVDNLWQTAWSHNTGKVKLDEAKTADPLVEEATALNVRNSTPSTATLFKERTALKPSSQEDVNNVEHIWKRVVNRQERVEEVHNVWKRAWSHNAGKVKLDEAKVADPLIEETTALNVRTSSPSNETFLRESTALKRKTAVSEVNEFDCAAHGGPLQVLKESKGFVVKALNVETGKYKKVFSIPFSRTKPKFTDLNSCGINPIDGILYCGIKQNENYIIRIDEAKAEFVAKIPGTGHFNSGTFSPGGTYFIGNGKAEFLAVENLSEMKGYPSKKSKKLPDLSGEKLKKPRGFHSSADVVTVQADMEGLGEKDYLIVVNKGSVMIARYEDKKFKKTWVIKYKRGKKLGKWKEVLGAGWSFNGKVFFATNDGYGVYQVPIENLDLTKPVDKLEPITLPRIGDSEKSDKNDGANCMNSPDPWVTKVQPWNCKVYTAPSQVMREKSGYAVRSLEMITGKYTPVFDLPFTKTSPAYKYLNAVGISPVDSIPYGCLLFDEFPASVYIVRFDKDKIEYVAKIKGSYDPIAGSFASTGEYFFVHNTKNSVDPVLYSITGLDTMKGYANHADPNVADLSKIKGLTLKNFNQIADIVAVKYNLEGSKTASEYILGINRDRQVAIVKWNAADVSTSPIWKLSTNDVTAKVGAFENFGAAWNYEGRVFFASNDGVGVFETRKIDLAKKSITLRKMGKSAAIYNNDGFNCWNLPSPFPDTNPEAPVISAFTD